MGTRMSVISTDISLKSEIKSILATLYKVVCMDSHENRTFDSWTFGPTNLFYFLPMMKNSFYINTVYKWYQTSNIFQQKKFIFEITWKYSFPNSALSNSRKIHFPSVNIIDDGLQSYTVYIYKR